jgi:pyruvate dehydrogenase E2 component (dihydrolipoamide acetyltransferase)
MAEEFRFPDVGEGITEGEIVRWLVKEGDLIEEDQTLAEVETDKAVIEVPSPYSGTVLKRHFAEKDIVKVGEVMVTIGAEGEKAAAPPAEVPVAAPKRVPSAGVVGEIIESGEEIREVLATPKVRRTAREQGVDLRALKGTGPGGRITEEDVRSGAAGAAAPAPKTKAPGKIPKIKSKFDFYGTIKRIPLRGVRRSTARRMVQSMTTAAHVTHMDVADVSELVKIREDLKAAAQDKKIKLTYLPFIIRALIAALRLHPMLNATMDDEEEEILVKEYYNIGIAVDIPDGLIVPVVKLAEHKSLFQLAEEVQRLAQAAKERTLDLADLKGGTFSITNVGILGGEAATPIINYPEVAILATMRIADRIRVEEGKPVVKKTLPLCLSFDHRVIDGAEAARFMTDLISRLENPGPLLLEPDPQ